jgi:hypothetical protein
MDDFAVWNRAISASEVKSIYDAGKAGKAMDTVVETPPAAGDGTYKIGLNFGANQVNATLAASDAAGVEPQSNWNNLSGQNGTNATLMAWSDGNTAEATTASVIWSSNGTWASTGGGEENNKFTGTDRTLMTGYLDTSENSTTSVTITNLPSAVTTDGYDVYVYILGGVPNKGGAYRILDAATGAVLKDYVLAQSPANPTNYTAVPMTLGTTNAIGTYLLFTGLSAPAIKVEATTANGKGFGSTAFRAPINAIQLISPSSQPLGPAISVARDATGKVVITYEGKLQGSDTVNGAYTDVVGATSPYTVTTSGGAKFYRSVK